MRIYDLSMNYLGLVNVITPGSGGTQPHPMIFQAGNLLYLLTFDDVTYPVSGGVSFSWGQIVIYASPRY